VFTVIFVIGVPIAFHGLMWLDHARSFSGTCGPHAPDIAAHPCTYDEHMREFAAGFAGIGLLLVEGAIFAGASSVAGAAWTVALLLRRRR